MKQTILALCRELAEESNAIIKYTEDIASVSGESPATAAVMEDIRLDELEHLQKLTLELSRVLVGAEAMAEVAGGEAE